MTESRKAHVRKVDVVLGSLAPLCRRDTLSRPTSADQLHRDPWRGKDRGEGRFGAEGEDEAEGVGHVSSSGGGVRTMGCVVARTRGRGRGGYPPLQGGEGPTRLSLVLGGLGVVILPGSLKSAPHTFTRVGLLRLPDACQPLAPRLVGGERT